MRRTSSSATGRGAVRRPTAHQTRALRRLAQDATTPARVAERARRALAEAAARAGAATTGGTAGGLDRRLAGRWLDRFLADGVAGLHDRPRPGRPSSAPAPTRWQPDDAETRRLLTAPLFAPDPAWSSQSVATALGTSQSSVARAWHRVYGVQDARTPLPSGARLVAASMSPENSLLVLAVDDQAPQDVLGVRSFMRSARRRPFQTVLAGALLAAGPPDGDEARQAAGGLARDTALLAALRERDPAAAPLVALTRHRLPEVDPASGVRQVVVADQAHWQALLPELVAHVSGPSTDVLAQLQQQVMHWARGGAPRFEWTDGTLGPRPASPSSGAPRATAQVVADDLFAMLVDRIVRGRLRGGDRITESELARALHTTRTHVRDALRTLGANGLVDLEPHRGAVVPTPRVADVVETYAVRRGLGVLVVRRAVQLGPDVLGPVDRALERMLETARTTNDSYLTGDADLDLQDVLADVTGMRRAAPMFRTTTAQIRLYVAVMGMNYAYPIPDMCQDDITLLRHLHDRDEQAAVAAWNAKLDAAISIMTSRVRHVRVPGAPGGTAPPAPAPSGRPPAGRR